MKKIIVLFASLFILSFSTYAQLAKVSGTVKDDGENKPVKNAVIALLIPKDSILYKFTRTNVNGKYLIKDVKPGNYILMTTHPYFADLVDNVDIQTDMELPLVKLKSKVEVLQEVIVKSGNPIHLRGDTTVYTADSFKVSANANVEELLKKLPGIQVDKNGTITAMGETVSKVLVDGEEFFGDDPGMTIKNLRADAVKEVQVFDKKSDQAEFTGIDDGKTQKTINLKLKDNSKTGYFGKVDVSGGPKPESNIADRYNDNLMFSDFKGKEKLSAYFLNGNTGQDQLSWQDEQKYAGGDDNFSLSVDDNGDINFNWVGNDDNEPTIDPQNGFMTNVNAGGQYSNKWDDKTSLNFSPKYQDQQYRNNSQTFTQTQVGDSVLNQNSNDFFRVNRYNFKMRGILDIKLDSMNSLKITANANFYHTESYDSTNSIGTGGTGTLKNYSNTDLQKTNDKSALSGNLLFKHKFKKPRRTLTFNANWYDLNSQGTNYLKSVNEGYFNGDSAGSQLLNQMINYNTSTNNLSATVVYTEPLAKEYSLELGYKFAYNNGNNDQFTYNYSPFSGKYDAIVDTLSNQFKENIIQNIPSAKINFANKKVKVNVGVGFGFTNFDLKDVTYDTDYVRNYINFYPTANITYTYKPNRSIRFNYNGYNTQPTINQLQPLRNDNNYFNQYLGNPNLKPSFTNSFNISHSSYDFLKDIETYEGLHVNLINNSITNNQIINIDSGTTISQPINTNGNVSVSFYGGMGFKIKKIDARFDVNTGLTYTKYTGELNSEKSLSKTLAPNISPRLSKSKEKKYDVSISDGISYNNSTTSQNNTNIHYFSNTLSFYGTIYYKKVWAIITDYNYFTQQTTLQTGKVPDPQIWNATLQRTFKKDEFTAYFKVNDILNQNIGINRSFYGNTYTQVTNERLKRYFMIGFTWNFKNKATK